MGKSKIEWTNETWNPTIGCTKVSPGCKNCYAIPTGASVLQKSMPRGVGAGMDYAKVLNENRTNWNGQIHFRESMLYRPLSWVKPRVVFVNSMSDLFHENLSEEKIKQIFDVMIAANWHTFQILTKRHERMRDFVNRYFPLLHRYPHIWLGVSVEDRQNIERIDALKVTPAFTKFISAEPLLGCLGELDLFLINWVIVGGESGKGARPMEEDWVWYIQRQCDAYDVSFFFKQWGGINKRSTGRLLGGVEWNDMPAIEELEPPTIKERRRLIEDLQAKHQGLITV